MQEWAQAAGLEVEERCVTLQDLTRAEEVFYTNALYGIRPVVEIDGHAWSKWPVAERLFAVYREHLA